MGGIADELRLAFVDFLQQGDIVEDRQDLGGIPAGEGRQENREGMAGVCRLLARSVHIGDGLGLLSAAYTLGGLGKSGTAQQVDAMALQRLASKAEQFLCFAVGVGDMALLVDEHDRIVHLLQHQAEFLGFSPCPGNPAAEVFGQQVDGLDQLPEFVLRVPSDAMAVVAMGNDGGIVA